MSLQDEDRAYLRAFEEDAMLVRQAFFSRTQGGVIFSWVGEMVVGAPRYQGNCSCCVHCVMCDLLAARLALQHNRDNRTLLVFAVQHLLDCMKHRTKQSKGDEVGKPNQSKGKKGDDVGKTKRSKDKKSSEGGCKCKTSTFKEVFSFLKNRPGIVEEYLYRFEGKPSTCRDAPCDEEALESATPQQGKNRRIKSHLPEIPSTAKRAKVTGQLKTENVRSFVKMTEQIKRGPMAITVDSTFEFRRFDKPNLVEQVYPPRINSSRCSPASKGKGNGGKPNKTVRRAEVHALLIVGYGYDADSQRNFYLVKNSWGKNWGFRGYAKLAVDMFDKEAEAYYFDDPVIYE